ncbi:MAG: glycoside hydrolase family 2 protein [Bacteroidota bacterium]|nr:glycoside hydrolase family 2 protein [Bacteroidota bacterium]
MPADPFPSRITPDKYNLLLGQARDAGMNMMRSWGGGIYEPEAFWHACNTMGIMVSQDFLLACAGYPDEEKDFVDLLKREFTANIRLLRNNPSLIFWCGDNELGLGAGHDDGWACKTMHGNMTKPLVESMDPSRCFRITSPWGGERNNSDLAGDCHINAEYSDEIKSGDLKDYRSIIDRYSAGRFMSEHAAAGAPPKRTLLKFMTDNDLMGSEMLEYHTKDNPYAPGSMTLFQVVERCAKKLYGDPGEDIDRRIRQLEYVQYDFVRLAMEDSRRRKFYTSGIQFWMYNDCWPASGWSLIDYWGGRKAAWYAMAAGSRPVIAASENNGKTIKWWVCNDLYNSVKVNVNVKVQPFEGKASWTKQINITVPANSSVVAVELPLEEIKQKLGHNAILVCDLNYEHGYDRSWWTEGLPKDLLFPKTNLAVTEKRSDDQGEVTIHSDKWGRVVTLDADVDFEDNYFEMLPGETRTIKWKSHTGPFGGAIKVNSWN